MGTCTLTRWLVLASVAAALGHSVTEAATLGLGVPPLQVGQVPSVDSMTLSVSLQALAVTDSKYIRSSWLDELNVTAFDESGRTIPLRVIARRSEQTTVLPLRTPRKGVRQDAVSLSAELDVEGIPPSGATLRVEYQDLKNEITVRPKGDANETTGVAKSVESGMRTRTYAEWRAETMRRLEEIPDDYVSLWSLVERALLFAPREETEEYLSRAIANQHAFVERMKKSENPMTRALVHDVEADLRSRERMASAIRSLLPEYYANREELRIHLDWRMGWALLLDRESREMIKWTSGTLPDDRDEEDVPRH
jgi:hypothetical protein